MVDFSSICIGTAQFGMKYGITNQYGVLEKTSISSILQLAQKNNIRFLDTASVYGDSEKLIGDVTDGENDFEIITKIPKVPGPPVTGKGIHLITTAFENSLSLLRQSNLYGLLIHHGKDVLMPGGGKIVRVLQSLKESGSVRKIGVSVYSPLELKRILEVFIPDIVQIPISLVDQRFLNDKDDILGKIKRKGVEIHGRSIFLQGLLLQEPEGLPPCFGEFKGNIRSIGRMAEHMGITKLELCLSFALGMQIVDKILIGVASVREFEEIIGSSVHEIRKLNYSDFAVDDDNFVNPSLWKVSP